MRRTSVRGAAAGAVAAALAALALALGGCGFGAGTSAPGAAQLDVTRDFGRQHFQPARLVHVHESDTVMRFLQATHKVDTRYGGGFVQSIDGLAGDRSAQRDWFFYVNGIEAGVGAADFGLSPAQKGLMAAIPLLGGSILRLVFGHLTDTIGGVYASLHSDLDIPCGCCVFQLGFRAEWDYTWSDILQIQNKSDVQDINLMVSLGVRY